MIYKKALMIQFEFISFGKSIFDCLLRMEWRFFRSLSNNGVAIAIIFIVEVGSILG